MALFYFEASATSPLEIADFVGPNRLRAGDILQPTAMYELLLLVGGMGFVAMVLMGMMHFGGHHGAQGHAAHSLGHGHGHGAHPLGDGHAAAHHGHAGDAHAHGHAQGQGPKAEVVAATGPSAVTKLFGFLPSPMDLFALAAGFGATGIFLKGLLSPEATLVAALAGALFLTYAVVKPVFGLVGRFVSVPTEGLEGQVAHAGEALGRFDAQGRGLVRLTLDGQIVQLLARLEQDEVARGVEVAKGDSLLVVEVDAASNTCRVTRELAQ